MRELAAARLTGHLNALAADEDPAPAAAAVRGRDVAHHVADPDGLTGLDAWRAVDLAGALPVLVAAERTGWVLALPVAGALGPLRGPAALNAAALEAGAAVVAVSGGLALVPYPVGPAVQWRVLRAAPPASPPSPYEAERALSEAILLAARALSGSGSGAPLAGRPDPEVALPRGSAPRQVAAAVRAARLLLATDVALPVVGVGYSSHEVGVRHTQLRAVRAAAADALCAAVSRGDRQRVGWR